MMKSDVSVPASIHAAAEQLACTLGVSLSDLYTAALVAYVGAHQREDVTEALDRVYAAEPSAIEAGLVSLQIASVGFEPW